MPLTGSRLLPDPEGHARRSTYQAEDDLGVQPTQAQGQTEFIPLTSPTIRPIPSLNSTTTLPFPSEPNTGYLDPYIYTPAPQPPSYTGPGPKRNVSSGSRSLAPSDSASNFGPDEMEQERYVTLGPAGLGRQKSTLRGLEEEQGQGFSHHYEAGYGDRPGSTARGGYPPGPYPFGAQAQAQGQGQGQGSRPISTAGLSYVDEEGGYYRSDRQRPGSNTGRTTRSGEKQGQEEEEGESLVGGASFPAGSPFAETHGQKLHGTSLYPPSLDSRLETPPKWYEKLLGIGQGKYPVEQQIENKRRGVGKQQRPYACWVWTLAMCGVMVWELISQNQAQGTPIAIKPNFNYMVGPSSGVLINDGARFVPCIKRVPDLPPSFLLACLNDTSNPPDTACTLGSLCGFGGIADDAVPNQWFRFILPIFLHVGIVHLLLNMLAQLTIGAQVEREMGTIAFVMTYFAGGIYGFILGGNFSRTGIPSAGASGALFACSAVMVVDLALHWKYEDRPALKAFFLFLEFGVGIAIGYIPFAVDGMAHLGGYAMGLLCGMILMPAILPTKRKAIIVWSLRAVALVLVILGFALTIKNFYTDDPNAACKWCKYLSCIPTKSNGHCTGTGLTMPNDSAGRVTQRALEL